MATVMSDKKMKEKTTKMTGADALIKSLEAEGVEIIFGIPGGVLLPIYDAIYMNRKVKHILMRHEQCAAHAADGYARATGKVGVCVATSGPGATNLVTGIANAYMDSIPIVAITGQVTSSVIGTDAFQEADITGITLPIVKHSYLVKDVNDLPRIIKEAFYLAKTGRPGPVLIDIPKDISLAEINFSYPSEINLPGYKPTVKANHKQIRQAAKAIIEAKKPVIYAGGGVISAEAAPELTALVELAHIPVTTTLLGIGVINSNHKLNLGMLGMHGSRYANYAITETDLIIAVGVRFDDRVTGKLQEFAKGARVIHADIDPAEIGKNVEPKIPIVGSAKNVLHSLVEELKKHSLPRRSEWLKQIEDWKKKHPFNYEQKNGIPKPEFVVDSISELTKGKNTIITTGVGQNQMWAAQYYKAKRPRTFISSGGLGTMGFGLPSAIGAQFGKPKDLVFVIDGDGSFQMVSQELTTIKVNNLPVKIAILNNSYLGMVRQWQQIFHGKHYSASCLQADYTCPPGCSQPGSKCPPYVPDFVKLAEAYGITGLRVDKAKDVKKTIEKAIKTAGPVLIEFIVEKEENVFPMVAPGAPINQMIDREDIS